MMEENRERKIRVAIVDDHQSIIDGYIYRLQGLPEVEIVTTGLNGEDLQAILAAGPLDVLLLDVSIPSSAKDPNPYPVFHELPGILRAHPDLKIIVISMFTQLSLVQAMFNLGISAYIFKDDQDSILLLGNVVRAVADGAIYMSQGAYSSQAVSQPEQLLTPRQLEILSLCMADPNITTDALAERLSISTSTCRNLLSGAYRRLGVGNRAAAIAEAQRLGFLPDNQRWQF